MVENQSDNIDNKDNEVSTGENSIEESYLEKIKLFKMKNIFSKNRRIKY